MLTGCASLCVMDGEGLKQDSGDTGAQRGHSGRCVFCNQLQQNLAIDTHNKVNRKVSRFQVRNQASQLRSLLRRSLSSKERGYSSLKVISFLSVYFHSYLTVSYIITVYCDGARPHYLCSLAPADSSPVILLPF